MSTRSFSFIGGVRGNWAVTSATPVAGEPLVVPDKLESVPGLVRTLPAGAAWILCGVTSNDRYVNRAEKQQLQARQAALGRPEATAGAFIPIRKNAAWWALTQDERRAIFEEQSQHVKGTLRYLPAIARRLHHCRDLGEPAGFDFLTLFDYAPSDESAFNDLAAQLRASEEWKYVDREFDIRIRRVETVRP